MDFCGGSEERNSSPAARAERTAVAERSGSALNLRGFHHLSMVVRDCEKSTVFYRDLLGFVECERPGALLERGVGGNWLFGYGESIARPSASLTPSTHRHC